MSKPQPTVPMNEDMHRRIKRAVENGEWSGQAEYIRHLIVAGESDIAELDPRTNSSNQTIGFNAEKAILDGLSDEYQDVDDVLDSALNSLATKLDEMANSEESPVEYHPRKGYKLDS
jgi:Arc/MetJ-type ribon-helix-helix transcriptional regulator